MNKIVFLSVLDDANVFGVQCGVCMHVWEQEVTAIFMFNAWRFSAYSARRSLL